MCPMIFRHDMNLKFIAIFDREQSLCGLTFMNVGMRMRMRMTFVKILLISLEFVTGYDWL